MYKTLYAVTVHPIQGDPVEFSDNDTTPGAGYAVLAQLTANKDVDSVIEGDGDISHVIIPYHAIEYVIVEAEREEHTYEDDNCASSGGDTGTLKIANTGTVKITNMTVAFKYDVPGIYGGIEFSTVTNEGVIYIVGTIPEIPVGQYVEIDGIPVGTEYRVMSDGASKTGTVPNFVDWIAGPIT